MATQDIKVVLSDQDKERILDGLRKQIKVKFTAGGHKSSEGDGRTAADIERELKEQHGIERNRP